MPLVMPARPNPIRMFLERELGAAGLSPHVAYEIEGVGSILELVRDGAGYAVLPISAVQTPGYAGAFLCQPVSPGGFKIRLTLAVSARRRATYTQKEALQLLIELIRATSARLPCLQGITDSADSP